MATTQAEVDILQQMAPLTVLVILTKELQEANLRQLAATIPEAALLQQEGAILEVDLHQALATNHHQFLARAQKRRMLDFPSIELHVLKATTKSSAKQLAATGRKNSFDRLNNLLLFKTISIR